MCTLKLRLTDINVQFSTEYRVCTLKWHTLIAALLHSEQWRRPHYRTLSRLKNISVPSQVYPKRISIYKCMYVVLYCTYITGSDIRTVIKHARFHSRKIHSIWDYYIAYNRCSSGRYSWHVYTTMCKKLSSPVPYIINVISWCIYLQFCHWIFI